MSARSPSLGTVCPHPPILITQRLCFPIFLVHLFWPVVKIRWRAWCARIRTLSLSSAVRDAAASKYLDDLCPVGNNPLDFTIVTKAWAGVYLCSSRQPNLHSSGEILSMCHSSPFGIRFSLAGIDDCDYNLHLSNSSYPKVSGKHLFSVLSLPPEILRGGHHTGMGAEGDA